MCYNTKPLAFALYPRDVTEELQMSRRSTKYEEELRYVINQIGPETIMRLLPPSEEAVRSFLTHVSPESLATALESQSPTERAQWIDALLDRLDPNEVEARLQARQAHRQG
jgi:hypothetical protein